MVLAKKNRAKNKRKKKTCFKVQTVIFFPFTSTSFVLNENEVVKMTYVFCAFVKI